MSGTPLFNVTCVAVDGRGLLIEGAPGSGKSTLALALIDRGAVLVGDDGVVLERRGDSIVASPPPSISGRLEVRGVGIVKMPAASAPLALVLALSERAARVPDVETRDLLGLALPCLLFDPHSQRAELRAEWALRLHGRPGSAAP